MKHLIFAAIALIISSGVAMGADLTSYESDPVKVKINYGHGIAVEYNHLPNFTYRYICANCEITVNNQTLNISGADKAVIENGKVSIKE